MPDDKAVVHVCGDCGAKFSVVAVFGGKATEGVEFCPYCGGDDLKEQKQPDS